jgi:hypothetical protein
MTSAFRLDESFRRKKGVIGGGIDDELGRKMIYASPLTQIDPFVLVRNDPQDAQLISWQL